MAYAMDADAVSVVAADTGDVSADDGLKKPQEILNEFWDNLISKNPGKVTTIFPPTLWANLLPPHHKKAATQGINAAKSYQAAADDCKARVSRIVRECHRTNEKFSDPDFDIESDFGFKSNCLKGLLANISDDKSDESGISSGQMQYALSTLATSGLLGGPMCTVDLSTLSKTLAGQQESSDDDGPMPGSVHRIDWIFDKPSFSVDGYSSSDVRQGANGDCWFISAVATLCTNQELMDKICVARDEECGVYGFVFHRDGEWFPTVVDDNLYLHTEDFEAQGDYYDPRGEKERKWKKNHQTGSDALHFAKCADPNETWLPLLEKAYAKAHGDYEAIAGGYSGEAIEDLTGGVSTKMKTSRILSKNRLWEELLEVNERFLFAVSSPGGYGGDDHSRKGLALNHAYSLIRAVQEKDEEGKEHKLVLIRNPWGERGWDGNGEWNGPWSDGSKEWTPYWMQKLNHTFGDDGLFWMSYEDMLKRFDILERTRLFDEDWTVVQQWTSVNVSWVTGYLTTKFVVEIKQGGPTVFVLSQLDDRYFRGLEGQYEFDLHFLLQEEGAAQGEHLVRARGAWWGNRSISAEVDLEPGRYEVVPKIVSQKDPEKPSVQDVVRSVADKNPQKLRQIGLNYDVANAKGVIDISTDEKEAEEKKKKEEEEKAKEKVEFELWKKEKKEREEKEKEKEKQKKKQDKKNKPALKGKGKQRHVQEESEAEDEEEESEAGEEGEWVDEDDDDDEESDAESNDETEPATAPPANTKKNPNPWNAVCIMGLRVYAQDPAVSITLIKPKDEEEAASLDVDGNQAGATM
jgi:hypothetical protein